MNEKTTKYDVVEHLRTPEEMIAYLVVCIEEADGNIEFINKAKDDVRKALEFYASRSRNDVAEDETTIILTRRESLRLLDLIENPPPRTEKFIKAMADYQRRNIDGSDSSIDWSPQKTEGSQRFPKDRLLDVVSVRPIQDFKLFLEFESGEKRIFDMKPYLEKPVFAQLKDYNLFSQATVDYGTVVWPGNIDISPEALYDRSVPA